VKIFNQTACHSPLLLLMLLTSCGPVLNPYNEDFNCRAKDDAGECIDTPTAYKKARYPETATEEKSEPTNGLKQEIQDNRYKVLAGLLQEEKKPLLQPPKILRVLLLPYKGEGEELFMSRYVYVKIEDSKWILTDLTEQ
jgi:conjugal transfer pilus assembly protein TraV